MSDKLETEVLEIDIADIHFDLENANTGTERGADMIQESVATYGFLEAGVLDRNACLVAGNKRTSAAVRSGVTDAIIVKNPQHKPIYVQYDDLDLDSPDPKVRQRSRGAAYTLNRSFEVSMKWDAAQIERDVASGLNLAALFDHKELQAIIQSKDNIPNVDAQSEPTLDYDHIVEIFCSETQLESITETLTEWANDGITVAVS